MKRMHWVAWPIGAILGMACSRASLNAIVGPDAGVEVAPDVMPDAIPDATPEAKADSGNDVLGDVAPDARTDGVPDLVVDSAPAITCPSAVLKPGNTTETLTVGGSSRSYVLHVPGAYDGSKPVPLVLDFHALFSTGANQQRTSPFPAQTDPEGVIMAFPNGAAGPLGSAWNIGPCCVEGVDDVAFARAIVAQVKATACIDPRRVYAVGTSMGGGMAYQLACRAADVFAGVAASAFDLVKEQLPTCKPTRPIPVISFRGTADNVVPYQGGPSGTVPGMPVTFLGAEVTFTTWAQLNQCTGAPSAPDGNGCQAYPSCLDGVEVALCTKQGGGQEVPDATYAWPILKRHTL
jgi:polyhydroxybutyrate depolymerase